MKILAVLILICSCQPGLKAQDTTKILVKDSTMVIDLDNGNDPEFPGGNIELEKFIHSKMIYPESDIEMRNQGTVYIQFVVNTDGSISDITVAKGVTPTIDAEAVRVFKLMPKWIPGTYGGKPVRTRMTVPVHFKMSW